MSIAGLCVLCVLLVIEVSRYAFGWDAYHTEAAVDMNMNNMVPFNIDITFPGIPCHELSLSAMDATGHNEADVSDKLLKTPTDADGQPSPLLPDNEGYVSSLQRPIAGPGAQTKDGTRPNTSSKGDDDEVVVNDPRSPNYCGPCPHPPRVAPPPKGSKCCNSCDSVIKAYEALGQTPPKKTTLQQCIWEISRGSPGCNLKGTFKLPKVKGNIHFAPGVGQNMPPFGQYGHMYSLQQLMGFNTTHIINEFSLGDHNIVRFSKRGVKSPLKGTRMYVTTPGMLAYTKYFISVVPTNYRVGEKMDSLEASIDSVRSGQGTFEEFTSYEYAVQSHGMEFNSFAGMVMMDPMVMFLFDFHPIQITNVFKRPPFTHFLTKMCSIVGGVFVLLGFIDSAVSKYVANR